MITAHYLQTIGFEKKESYLIMDKLVKLKCNVESVKIHSNYIRNGIICDYLHYGNGINRVDAIDVLKRYIEDMPSNAIKSKWIDVYKTLESK